ncbi:unnamed protein product [Auanema sp. JU1783]|nr:unnamed protein product [Auanema sp. JU1783]
MVLVEQPSLLERADLSRTIPENARKLSELVNVQQKILDIGEHSVFIHEASPPGNHYSKGTIIFLHGQAYTSNTWLEHETLRTIAALGYHCVAPDLPGNGRTRGPTLAQKDKPLFMLDFITALGVKKVMIVAASMSSQYILPLLSHDVFICVVAIALSNTHEIIHPSSLKTPVLVLWGDRDTSLGPSSASNLRCLPNARLEKVPNAGHSCYLNNPLVFQQLCINFFDLIRNYHSI